MYTADIPPESRKYPWNTDSSVGLATLTEAQTKELEKVYINNQFQDAAVLRELSHRLELTDNQIQVRQNYVPFQSISVYKSYLYGL